MNKDFKLLITILFSFLILWNCSSNKTGNKKLSNQKKSVNQVLEEFSKSFNRHSIEDVLKLYSRTKNNSLYTKTELEELFSTVQDIQIKFSNIKIKTISENKARAELNQKKTVLIGKRTLTESQKVKYFFDKENNSWKISSIELELPETKGTKNE